MGLSMECGGGPSRFEAVLLPTAQVLTWLWHCVCTCPKERKCLVREASEDDQSLNAPS